MQAMTYPVGNYMNVEEHIQGESITAYTGSV